ncbi:glycosyltransferase [Photobacterium aphoticum]|uniref:Glycosyltransferase 2-like domain-containing protein n=1 Tax=Photobacterium aphoticum TaxID=754436 RepID=A0A0J1GHA8_9GAMM|nr:glycosyltransferase [Photobacterium aphoticum]KLU98873.1 hypothetical protein ABT58_20225 [Photobacterium aphoticum]PSU56686.1 hypothetical protein C9I90_12195 [Photobacterium aphoticum]GHA38914.1 hypothetical protein GCM10007086_10560 [Photobacterium aphoticum]
MRKIVILCVLYNKKCTSSNTVNTFRNSKYRNSDNVELHIWDNTVNLEIAEFNKLYIYDRNIHYHSSGENKALSIIYNDFINNYRDDYLLILDDDSEVNDKYIYEVIKLLNNDMFCVGVPKIISQIGDMYSPAKFGLVKGKHFKTIHCGFHNNLTAISSGIVINCNKIISKEVSFDENLSLYGIDTDFFVSLNKKQIPTYVLDVSLSHDLSIFNVESVKTKKFRFLNMMKANLYISKKRGWGYYTCFIIYMVLVYMKNINLFINRD